MSSTPPSATAMTGGTFATRRTLDDSSDLAGQARAIRRAKEGGREGFAYLYERYADNVFSYVRTILHDEHEAEDVTQQVFTKMLTSIKRYEPRSVPFSAWIIRIARNASIDHLRRNRTVLSDEVRAEDDGSEEIARDRRWSLRDALLELPEEQREVVVLRHLVGLSPPEIATRMSKTEGAIHALHHRGRRALQGMLEEQGSNPALAAAA
jgi:RNA polymerase sigma-70 factor (ECF subfamily)